MLGVLFSNLFDGVQRSSTLFLGILKVFPKTFNELELVVPFVQTHGNILS
jgi:hypothetical protein